MSDKLYGEIAIEENKLDCLAKGGIKQPFLGASAYDFETLSFLPLLQTISSLK